MANNFFKTLKSAFVTEIEENVPPTSNVTTKENTLASPVSPVVVVNTPVVVSQPLKGQVDDELLQKLCQVLEDSNLPGPDYLELKNVANNEDMQRAIPDELQRLTVSFITMKTNSPTLTKEVVLSSIDEYIQIMERERALGQEQLKSIWDEQIEIKKQSVAESELRITELQEELQTLKQHVVTQNTEIAIATTEWNNRQSNFNATVDFLVSNLQEDKKKLSGVLI